MCTLTVLRRFGFEAPLLRSGVVAVDGAAAANTAMLFVHGAPSVIEQLVSKDTLPSDYRQVIELNSSVCKALQGCGFCILPIQPYYCSTPLLFKPELYSLKQLFATEEQDRRSCCRAACILYTTWTPC